MEEQTKPTTAEDNLTARTLLVVVVLSVLAGAIGGMYGPRLWQESGRRLPYTQNVTLDEESAVIDAVKKASPAVVSITATNEPAESPDPFFSFFPDLRQVGSGSGFFISGDGLILTNKHVVASTTAKYTVVTNEGKSYDAEVLARDPSGDLALIKIDAKDVPFLELRDTSNLEVGQKVIAIGNTLGQYQNTVTSGIISGIGRSIVAGGSQGNESLEGVIQTDAAINPGNSGGPLLNILGQVVGINTAMDVQGELIGFAIPASDAKRAVQAFEKYGRIARPFLGVRYTIVSKELAELEDLPRDYGAWVVPSQNPALPSVMPGSPADKAGLAAGDIILEVDGKRIDEKNSLARVISNYSIGDTVTLKVFGKSAEKEIRLTLEERKQ